MCLNETYSRVCVGKHLSDMFTIRNGLKVDVLSLSGIKVFNHLPQYIKALTNDHKYFKSTLKRFLYHHSFYSMNKYYEYKEDRRI